MQIFVKTDSGKTITLEVTSTNTILDLKKMVVEKKVYSSTDEFRLSLYSPLFDTP